MRRLIVIIFLTATLVPTQVSAACAWILWTKAMFIIKGRDEPARMVWEPTAFDTHQECKSAKTKWLTRKPKPGETIKQMDSDIISIKDEDMTSYLSAKCLPDTMGPPP